METPGEDPRRIKGYVKALLAGLEGSEDEQKGGKKKIIATCKHYAGNDLERWKGVLRHNFDAIISTQDLVEYYLPPFQQCARDSKVGSVMCAYNAVNGTPACANTYLMQTVLRDHWGWTDADQYVTSDCNAVGNFYADHHWVDTAAEAAAKAYVAGTDTVCEYNMATDVVGAFNQTLLDEDTVDRALKRLYHGLVRVGYFDPASASPYRSFAWEDVNTEEAQVLALQSAVDGIVLKKNDGTLPLPFGENMETSVAVIGHWADNGVQLLGGYAGRALYYVTPRWVAMATHGATFYAPGPVAQTSSDRDTWTKAAVDAASQADVVLYFGGLDMTMEREDLDRMTIGWPEAQLKLIDTLCGLGKPCVVVQMGNQLDDSPLLHNSNVSAVVWAGYPGQAGGTAVFNILYGKSAPAGRLPITQYPATYVDEVPMTDMALRPSDSNPGRTYKWYKDAVLPFGYGLHYTEFEANFNFDKKSYQIDSLLADCKEPHPDLCPFDHVQVSVTNKGEVDSDFVALVCANGTYGPAPHPIKELVGYERLRNVKAGETAEVEIGLAIGDIARVDEMGNTVLYAGSYSLLLDVPTQDAIRFELAGDDIVLDKWPQPPEELSVIQTD
jgi:beta-D-xylosidase 4